MYMIMKFCYWCPEGYYSTLDVKGFKIVSSLEEANEVKSAWKEPGWHISVKELLPGEEFDMKVLEDC